MIKNNVFYLIGTENYGIIIPKEKENLKALFWSDAYLARNLTNRRSRSGMLVTVRTGTVMPKSKLELSTLFKTLQAKYVAPACTIKELESLRIVPRELHVIDCTPQRIMQDDVGAILWTEFL